MKSKWLKIISDLGANPRDLRTRPKGDRQPVWFRVSLNNNGQSIKITKAKIEQPSSKISTPRNLALSEFKEVYPFYLKRERGEKTNQEVIKITYNQSYWFSVTYACLNETESGNFKKLKSNNELLVKKIARSSKN